MSNIHRNAEKSPATRAQQASVRPMTPCPHGHTSLSVMFLSTSPHTKSLHLQIFQWRKGDKRGIEQKGKTQTIPTTCRQHENLSRKPRRTYNVFSGPVREVKFLHPGHQQLETEINFFFYNIFRFSFLILVF